MRGKDGGAVTGLPLGYLVHTATMPEIQGCASMARMRATPRGLSGQSGTGTAGSISTSGWVMKKTVAMRRWYRTTQRCGTASLKRRPSPVPSGGGTSPAWPPIPPYGRPSARRPSGRGGIFSLVSRIMTEAAPTRASRSNGFLKWGRLNRSNVSQVSGWPDVEQYPGVLVCRQFRQCQSVHVGEHSIDHGQVELVALDQQGAVPAILCRIHIGRHVLPQAVGDDLTNQGVVIDDQDAVHCSLPPGGLLA